MLPPLVLNVYKPPGVTSQKVVAKLKRELRGQVKKIGHFGTLDPFAEGLLLIGINGAQRLNDFVHNDYTKTYVAHGLLGVETDTGDPEGEVLQRDETEYFRKEISKFTEPFLQEFLTKEFLGEYWQSPHKFSAAKFQGRALHEWARAGVEIEKPQVKRHVHKIEVLSFDFPKLVIRFEVSSGTYIRSLFADCAKRLGTLGSLEGLVRERVGAISYQDKEQELDQLLKNSLSPEVVLGYPKIYFREKEAKLLRNGVILKQDRAIDSDKVAEGEKIWAFDEQDNRIGLYSMENGSFRAICNL